MRLVIHHVRASTLELLRYPAFSVPTLAFPTLLFLLFAAPGTRKDPQTVMASFAAVAVLGVVLFQFGVGIAAERASPWEGFVRTLPLRISVRLAARILSGLIFASVSGAAVLLAAVLATPVSLPPRTWIAFAVALLVGSVPFALLGIALGYWIRPKAALPVANVLFLPLSFAGGLWGGPRYLPSSLEGISPYLPTRQWGNWLWRALDGHFWDVRAVLSLSLYGALFALFAVLGYRRDEGERFV